MAAMGQILCTEQSWEDRHKTTYGHKQVIIQYKYYNMQIHSIRKVSMVPKYLHIIYGIIPVGSEIVL